ncbi:helix-turn-helix domain-containing protein [Kiloniella laminariae]|uniref:helix-turn-helix domain-containing protein n=1 Tax=Kiloniella laminariae TaxID=454162 RepID=UPI00036619C7|nr:helix-turn-helix domain-containing protein [Kiloniella laminariae]
MKSAPSHAERIENAIAGNKAAQHFFIASWQRSMMLHRLDPEQSRSPERLSDPELQQARERVGPLIRIASDMLDRLYLAVGGMGCCVLLSDANGILLDRRDAAADQTTFDKWGLGTGAIWSELSEGTNGIGTCIAEERALTIHKDQHFHSKNVLLSCTAAPVFDQTGKLLAIIDVSSSRADLTENFSRLISLAVIDAARSIETEYFRHNFSVSRILLATPKNDINTVPINRQSPALIAVDQDDLVIGATRSARTLYGLRDKDLARPLPLSTLYGLEVDEARDYQLVGRRTIQNALARSGGNVTAAARALGINRATLHRKIKRLKLDA